MRARFGAKDKKSYIFFYQCGNQVNAPLPAFLPSEPEPTEEGEGGFGVERQFVTTLIYTLSLSVCRSVG